MAAPLPNPTIATDSETLFVCLPLTLKLCLSATPELSH